MVVCDGPRPCAAAAAAAEPPPVHAAAGDGGGGASGGAVTMMMREDEGPAEEPDEPAPLGAVRAPSEPTLRPAQRPRPQALSVSVPTPTMPVAPQIGSPCLGACTHCDPIDPQIGSRHPP
jgi:hypothetical protein